MQGLPSYFFRGLSIGILAAATVAFAQDAPAEDEDGDEPVILVTGYRASLGFEYWFWEHVGLRAGYHRQNAGGVADEMGAGLAFRF